MPPDVAEPESSPGTEEFVESSLEGLTTEQYQQWQKTGELPKANSETSPPSTKTDETPPEGGKSKGTQEAGKGKGVKVRNEELDADIQELEAKLQRRAELKRQAAETGEAKTVPPPTEKPVELKAPVKPIMADFSDYEKFDEAKDKYYEDLADYRTTVKLQEYKAEREEQAKREQFESENKVVAERWNKQIETVAAQHSDWNEVAAALAPLTQDPRFAAGAAYMLDNETEHGAEIAYHLGTHLDEAKAIVAMSPIRQVKALTLLDNTLKPKPAEKPVKPIPPGPKKVTETPPPVADLSGRNAPGPDAIVAAIQNDDPGEYIRLANARDAAEQRRVRR